MEGKRAPKEGEIMTNPGLAETFEALADHGKKGFYEALLTLTLTLTLTLSVRCISVRE